jgi:hypothetical protein
LVVALEVLKPHLIQQETLAVQAVALVAGMQEQSPAGQELLVKALLVELVALQITPLVAVEQVLLAKTAIMAVSLALEVLA